MSGELANLVIASNQLLDMLVVRPRWVPANPVSTSPMTMRVGDHVWALATVKNPTWFRLHNVVIECVLGPLGGQDLQPVPFDTGWSGLGALWPELGPGESTDELICGLFRAVGPAHGVDVSYRIRADVTPIGRRTPVAAPYLIVA
jgi:hypothetical protein